MSRHATNIWSSCAAFVLVEICNGASRQQLLSLLVSAFSIVKPLLDTKYDKLKKSSHKQTNILADIMRQGLSVFIFITSFNASLWAELITDVTLKHRKPPTSHARFSSERFKLPNFVCLVGLARERCCWFCFLIMVDKGNPSDLA